VSLGRPADPQRISYVATDNETAAYGAVTHLLNLGRRRVALLVGSLEPPHSQERLSGYRRAHTERALPLDDQLVAVGGMSESAAATRVLLRHRPDAIFLPTRVALDVLRVLRDAGLRVPEDIALIGFDDLPLAQQTDPPLTTVGQPMQAMGRQLVRMLLDQIENPAAPPQRVVFPQELIVRQSCGALRP
jgi:DNA-binding LacI/PurR family transcriptional regulator